MRIGGAGDGSHASSAETVPTQYEAIGGVTNKLSRMRQAQTISGTIEGW